MAGPAGTQADGWFLVDVEKRHDQYPTTFDIPSRKDREGLKENAFAKLVFTTVPLFAKNSGERMWVRVLGVTTDGRYHGMLANDPVLVDSIAEGTLVDFGPEHVADILPADVVVDPKVKEGDRLNDPVTFAAPAAKKGGGGIALLLIGGALVFAGKRKRGRRR